MRGIIKGLVKDVVIGAIAIAIGAIVVFLALSVIAWLLS